MTGFHWILLLLTVSLASAACSPGGGPVAHETPPVHSCSLSTLQVGPAGFAPYGLARAGEVWFSAFGRVDPGSPAMLAAPNGPYDGWKVVIHPDPHATGTVTVTGIHCSTGKPVRFCYDSCDWTTRLQNSVVTLAVNVGRHLDYTGYMVFPGPGLMRLSASDTSGGVAAVVIGVPQISS